MAITAAIVGGVIGIGAGIGGGLASGGAQKRGLRQAGHQIEEEMLRLRDFAEAQEAAGAPFGDMARQYGIAGVEALGPLTETVQRGEASPYFQLLAREGLNSLQQNFATRGSPQSSAAGLAAGRYMEGLVAQERARQVENLFNLAKFGQFAPQQYENAQERAARLRMQAAGLVETRAAATAGMGLAEAAKQQAIWGGVGALGKLIGGLGGGAPAGGGAPSGGMSGNPASSIFG